MPVPASQSKRGGELNWASFLFFLILVSQFAAAMFIANSFSIRSVRKPRINSYNGKTISWNAEDKNAYQVAQFSVNGKYITRAVIDSDSNRITADSCSQRNDPSGGCATTDSVWCKYSDTLSIPRYSGSILNKKGTEIFKWNETSSYDTIYTNSELGCGSDTSKCESKCKERGGTYSSICTVKMVLKRICIRVQTYSSGIYVLDMDSLYYKTYRKAGCFYEDKYNPFHYEASSSSVNNIDIEIRHYMDPVISASYYTQGCSDKYFLSGEDKKCFGEDENSIAVLIITILIDCAVLPILIIMLVKCDARITREKEEKKRLQEREIQLRKKAQDEWCKRIIEERAKQMEESLSASGQSQYPGVYGQSGQVVMPGQYPGQVMMPGQYPGQVVMSI